MKNIALIAFLAILLSTSSCVTRIDAGHVGLKVNMTGDEKGVSKITETTGWVGYIPGLTKVVEFPVYMQTKKYPEIHVTALGGSLFTALPQINYFVKTDRVSSVFEKFRLPLKQIEDGYLETAVNKVFRDVTNKFSPDSLISDRQGYEEELFKALQAELDSSGFRIALVTSNLLPPPSLVDAINAKNTAIQEAQTAVNQLATIEAQAKKNVAEAQGKADALVATAKGDAQANQLRQQSLTPMLIQQQWIDKWDGNLPATMAGNSTLMLNPIK